MNVLKSMLAEKKGKFTLPFPSCELMVHLLSATVPLRVLGRSIQQLSKKNTEVEKI